jgi:hypothetical protein
MKRFDEEWRDIEGFEGVYQISSFGRVKSLSRKNSYGRKIGEKTIKSHEMRGGYLRIVLHKDGSRKSCLIHRLVAKTFVPNPHNLPIINHKDENTNNNMPSNLEWCSNKYNINYGTRNKRLSQSLKKKIGQYSKNNKLIKMWESATDVKNELGYDDSSIRKCCNNRKNYNSAHGFKWVYANNEGSTKYA